MSYPPGEKRTTFNYNELPIQVSGLGKYASHESYQYLEGRKLDDAQPSGTIPAGVKQTVVAPGDC